MINNMYIRYVKALLVAAENHLNITGEFTREHLANDDAYLDNRTCRQAFIETFSEQWRNNMNTINHSDRHDKHETIIQTIEAYVSDMINTLQSNVSISQLFLSGKEIIASHMED